MWRICSNRFTPATAEAIFVVSDSGDILSPKYAPEITAPTAIAVGMPKPFPMPTNAMPTVPQVPQEVPVDSETSAQISTLAIRNSPGVKMPNP